jgi:8-oxo-dGTP pyrophosphatase MutT (NUDIX family)
MIAGHTPISEYLKGLRKKVGHDLVVLAAVSVSNVDNKGRLLLGKDAETNFWVLPGGAVDPHERPADAAVRERLEETGLLVELSGLIGVLGGPEFLVHYPNGDEVYYITTAFRGVVIGGSHDPRDGELSDLNCFSQFECERLMLSAPVKLIARTTFANSATPFFQPAAYSALTQPPEH